LVACREVPNKVVAGSPIIVFVPVPSVLDTMFAVPM